jgi:hypothetical protein
MAACPKFLYVFVILIFGFEANGEGELLLCGRTHTNIGSLRMIDWYPHLVSLAFFFVILSRSQTTT